MPAPAQPQPKRCKTSPTASIAQQPLREIEGNRLLRKPRKQVHDHQEPPPNANARASCYCRLPSDFAKAEYGLGAIDKGTRRHDSGNSSPN
eukprot:3147801-Rhodomonas_salina.3